MTSSCIPTLPFFARDPENGDQIRQKEDRHLVGYRGRLLRQTELLGLPLNFSWV